jgi:hypothetical protein
MELPQMSDYFLSGHESSPVLAAGGSIRDLREAVVPDEFAVLIQDGQNMISFVGEMANFDALHKPDNFSRRHVDVSEFRIFPRSQNKGSTQEFFYLSRWFVEQGWVKVFCHGASDPQLATPQAPNDLVAHRPGNTKWIGAFIRNDSKDHIFVGGMTSPICGVFDVFVRRSGFLSWIAALG